MSLHHPHLSFHPPFVVAVDGLNVVDLRGVPAQVFRRECNTKGDRHGAVRPSLLVSVVCILIPQRNQRAQLSVAEVETQPEQRAYKYREPERVADADMARGGPSEITCQEY